MKIYPTPDTAIAYSEETSSRAATNKIKTLIIGDVHGSTYWKEVVAENPDCRYAFLGDYLDPHRETSNKDLIDNLKDIIQFKQERPDNVVLLLGNHDMHYIDDDFRICCRFDEEIAEEAKILFLGNINLFTFAFQDGNHVYTHAGISQKWFLEDFKGDATKNIAEQLNNPRPDQLPALYRCGWYRGGEMNDTGGIFWADMMELIETSVPLQGYVQFTGHNRVEKIRKYRKNDGVIFFCDSLWNEYYLKV